MALDIVAKLFADIAAWPSTLVDGLHMFSLKVNFRLESSRLLVSLRFVRSDTRNHVSLTHKNDSIDNG